MTEEEQIKHDTLERSFLNCKRDKQNLLILKRELEKIIKLQNSAIKRKENYINKKLAEIERLETVNEALEMKIADKETLLKHREYCIDWILENYPQVITQYLGRGENGN